MSWRADSSGNPEVVPPFFSIDSSTSSYFTWEAVSASSTSHDEIPDDIVTRVIVAEELEQLDRDNDLTGFCSRVIDRRRNGPRPLLDPILHNSRLLYDKICSPSRDGAQVAVHGWEYSTYAVAADLAKQFTSHEVAVQAYYRERAFSRSSLAHFTVDPPKIYFGRCLLYLENLSPLFETAIRDQEPFFLSETCVSGYCGVSHAWMVLATDTITKIISEIGSFARKSCDTKLCSLSPNDIRNSDLGLRTKRAAAEAFSRHLSIEESAYFVAEYLASVADSEGSSQDLCEIESESDDAYLYVDAVLKVGRFAAPVIFDNSTFRKFSDFQRHRLVRLYESGTNIFEAFEKLVAVSQLAGIGMRSFSEELNVIKNKFAMNFPGAHFSAEYMHMTAVAMESGATVDTCFQNLVARKNLEEAERRVQLGEFDGL